MKHENFDALIKSLHRGTSTSLVDEELPKVIFIDEERRFNIPRDYNTTIAYEGDINSQVVTFDCPKTHEGHILSECDKKKIKWSNLASGVEGASDLILVEGAGEGRQFLRWEVPPEAFIKSGKLSISISIYDLDADGYIVFQWNTATCQDLYVHYSMDNVGLDRPAQDEVLTIDVDTKRIVAPSGYHGLVANYGDIGTSRVFLRVKRYVRGIDIFDQETTKTIRWKMLDQIYSTEENIALRLYTAETTEKTSNKEGLVDIIWTLPEELTYNNLHYAGNFDIEVSFMAKDGRIWRTNPFSGLFLGKSLFMLSPTSLPDNDEFYHINGNGSSGTGTTTEIAGIYTLRSFTEELGSPTLKKNELAIEYDENGDYVGIKVGTKITGESAVDAVYADKLVQGKTVILDGGNASGK